VILCGLALSSRWAVKYWCLQASCFDRQRNHKSFEVDVDDFGIPEDLLDIRAPMMPEAPDRDELYDDDALDSLEGTAPDVGARPKKRARATAKGAGRAKAKPKLGAAVPRRRGAAKAAAGDLSASPGRSGGSNASSSSSSSSSSHKSRARNASSSSSSGSDSSEAAD
jgi:hypothetical protein